MGMSSARSSPLTPSARAMPFDFTEPLSPTGRARLATSRLAPRDAMARGNLTAQSLTLGKRLSAIPAELRPAPISSDPVMQSTVQMPVGPSPPAYMLGEPRERRHDLQGVHRQATRAV